uniref:Dynamin-type G domain-containing protein n=2 Tax=Lotharella globosa TaxID=91324 RepID=A0A7S3YW24_9EUKA
MEGNSEKTIPGNAAVLQEDKPFETLKLYGTSLLNRFECVEIPNSPILENVTIIDSPGVLSGEKQRLERGYDFSGLVKHWAERSERILLLFDAHKLDISDELKEAIQSLKGNEDKIRCILNKADRVGTQELMRVYGALLWSLGKVVGTPEVMRIFVGSFWDKEYQLPDNAVLFDAEKNDLMSDIQDLPKNSTVRKINEFAKRLRHVKVHSLVCDTLRSKFSVMSLSSNATQQQKLLSYDKLSDVFHKLAKQHSLHLGDFPEPDEFRKNVEELDIKMWEFERLHQGYLQATDALLANEMPLLFNKLGRDECAKQ